MNKAAGSPLFCGGTDAKRPSGQLLSRLLPVIRQMPRLAGRPATAVPSRESPSPAHTVGARGESGRQGPGTWPGMGDWRRWLWPPGRHGLKSSASARPPGHLFPASTPDTPERPGPRPGRGHTPLWIGSHPGHNPCFGCTGPPGSSLTSDSTLADSVPTPPPSCPPGSVSLLPGILLPSPGQPAVQRGQACLLLGASPAAPFTYPIQAPTPIRRPHSIP